MRLSRILATATTPIHGNIHASYVTDEDIEQIKQIVDADLYIGIDGKKRPRTKATYKPTIEISTGVKSPVEKSDIEQARIDHSNARLSVQSAFFDNDMDKLDTEFPSVETGKKLDKFYALVVEKRNLRLNIFSPDIDLSVSEIREEIKELDQIAKDIRWYMQSEEYTRLVSSGCGEI